MESSNSSYMQYCHSELSVETFSVLWCVLMQCFASNVQFFKSNNYFVNSHIAEYFFFLLGNNLMCNLYVFGRVLGTSTFMHKLVSIDIHVTCAVRHST